MKYEKRKPPNCLIPLNGDSAYLLYFFDIEFNHFN